MGSRTFLKADAEQQTDYVRSRYRVLFDVWCPESEQFELTFLQCRQCGLIVYAPRPDRADLDAKYRYLGRHVRPRNGDSTDDRIARWKSKRLYAEIMPRVPPVSKLKILDFGGGSGELLDRFVRHGHQCDLVDYHPSPRDGVRRLGTSLEDVPKSNRYDVIVVSHVLEHVAEPVQLLESLRNFLGEGGVLFVEVPLECWTRTPHMVEPVTHVNFFDPESLESCLRVSGYRVCRVRPGTMLTRNGWVRVVRAIAKGVQSQPEVVERRDPSSLDKYLRPSSLLRIQYRLSAPRTWPASTRYHLQRLLRRQST